MNYKRTIAEIDLDALDYNIKNIKGLLSPKSKILGILKADAYGHGAMAVYQVLKENGVDIFSVATLDEALSLRNAGMDDDIIILGFTPEFCVHEVIENNITQAISSLREAVVLNENASKQNAKVKIHIKIDTGMSRLGFIPGEETVKEIQQINDLSNIEIEGIFTHFAVSDIKDKTFTNLQKVKFIDLINELDKKGVKIPLKHCSNSGALMDGIDTGMDLVRPGIILYGLYPSDEVLVENLALKPVMAIKTMVSLVKELEGDISVSYGRTYKTEGKRKIATIPIGYADGFSRLLSNKGSVIIKGVKVPIVGTICMDQCMIDVTEVYDVKQEDEVIVMGKVGDMEVTADDIARIMGTINYEVVCLVNKRIPRVYKRNGKIIDKLNYLL